MLRVTCCATIFLKQLGSCLMNFFHDWIIKLLAHSFLPGVRTAGRRAAARNLLHDKRHKRSVTLPHLRCADNSMWRESLRHVQPRRQCATHLSLPSAEWAFD